MSMTRRNIPSWPAMPTGRAIDVAAALLREWARGDAPLETTKSFLAAFDSASRAEVAGPFRSESDARAFLSSLDSRESR